MVVDTEDGSGRAFRDGARAAEVIGRLSLASNARREIHPEVKRECRGADERLGALAKSVCLHEFRRQGSCRLTHMFQ
jgi:hypothetical protein